MPEPATRTVTPVGDWIFVERDPDPNLAPGGILHPSPLMQNKLSGTVVAVGPGRARQRDGRRDAPDVRPGDRVRFRPLKCPEIESGGKKLLCLRPAGVFVKEVPE